MLIVGLKWSASGDAIASRPALPPAPSGTSATEPTATSADGNSQSRCVSRMRPQRGLPDANSDSNERSPGSSARATRR